eukprot:CAMPEP_0194376134 /NCGR_PEP_ID=MMETSP0174-20130528/24620_1 /TAXON_ID=216777 /ORGANISM="Proboscia alata, Strain PI-D3" /LENGTH=830 /DNA_ID=CAMNT_0039156701 /DNA_START=191 /DNA_END=2683 /DNA_ORIENTATION=+
MNLIDVREVAEDEKFQEIFFDLSLQVVSFSKTIPAKDTVKVFWSLRTVELHQRGKNKKTRRNVDMDLLRLIFQNPELNMGKTTSPVPTVNANTFSKSNDAQVTLQMTGGSNAVYNVTMGLAPPAAPNNSYHVLPGYGDPNNAYPGHVFSDPVYANQYIQAGTSDPVYPTQYIQAGNADPVYPSHFIEEAKDANLDPATPSHYYIKDEKDSNPNPAYYNKEADIESQAQTEMKLLKDELEGMEIKKNPDLEGAEIKKGTVRGLLNVFKSKKSKRRQSTATGLTGLTGISATELCIQEANEAKDAEVEEERVDDRERLLRFGGFKLKRNNSGLSNISGLTEKTGITTAEELRQKRIMDQIEIEEKRVQETLRAELAKHEERAIVSERLGKIREVENIEIRRQSAISCISGLTNKTGLTERTSFTTEELRQQRIQDDIDAEERLIQEAIQAEEEEERMRRRKSGISGITEVSSFTTEELRQQRIQDEIDSEERRVQEAIRAEEEEERAIVRRRQSALSGLTERSSFTTEELRQQRIQDDIDAEERRVQEAIRAEEEEEQLMVRRQSLGMASSRIREEKEAEKWRIQEEMASSRAREEKEADSWHMQEEMQAEEDKRLEYLEQEELMREERNFRGRYLEFWLDHSNRVSQIYNERSTCIACGGKATIMLYEGGGWNATNGLNKQLYSKLAGRNQALPGPSYIALGSQNRYYVKFEDGRCQWVGCDALSQELRKHRPLKTIAFGETWNSYFIVYEDGGYSYKGIPYHVNDIIQKNQCEIECVSLGPKGEYFMKMKNGRVWWGGMSYNAMNKVNRLKDRVKFIDFGENETFVCRYT